MIGDDINWFIAVIVGVYGLLAGSFVTAFTWRFKHKKNWISDRSRCDACKHILAPRDLVPVLSWVIHKRKCRFCKKPVSWQYPAIELATAVVFASSYIFWPFDLSGSGYVLFGAWLLFVTVLISLAVYDLRHMLLPNRIVFAATLVGAIYVLGVFLLGQGGIADDIAWWQPLVSALGLSGLFWLMYQMSQGTWIGGGDVKLAVSLGLVVLKPEFAFMLLLFASLFGTLYGLPLMILKKKSTKTRIPFGPMLITACGVVVLFGDRILDWYL